MNAAPSTDSVEAQISTAGQAVTPSTENAVILVAVALASGSLAPRPLSQLLVL